MLAKNLLPKSFSGSVCFSFEKGMAALRAGCPSVEECCRQAIAIWCKAQPPNSLYGVPEGSDWNSVVWPAYLEWMKKDEAERNSDRLRFERELNEKALAHFRTPEAWMAGFASLINWNENDPDSVEEHKRLEQLKDGSYVSEYASHGCDRTRMIVLGENFAFHTGDKIDFGWVRQDTNAWMFFRGIE